MNNTSQSVLKQYGFPEQTFQETPVIDASDIKEAVRELKIAVYELKQVKDLLESMDSKLDTIFAQTVKEELIE